MNVLKSKAKLLLALSIVHCSLFIDNAFALGGGQPASGEGATPTWMVFIPWVLIFLVFYFLIIRPQHKKQKDLQNMLDAIKKGDRVVTTGGVHGTVTGIKEKDGILMLQVAKDVQIEVSRSAISRVTESKEKK